MSYFSPTFFAPSIEELDDPSEEPHSCRDRNAFQAIVSALSATGAFATVHIAPPVDRSALPVGDYPVALVEPLSWVEVEDTTPDTVVRHVTFALTLMVRCEGGFDRICRLDQLSAVAHNALAGSVLCGGCLPATTRLRKGRFDPKAIPPEGRLVLTGEFSYHVSSVAQRDVGS
jgi:hypothetical protein